MAGTGSVTITKDLGAVSAYAEAVAAGYTGTKAQWESEIANASNNAQAAHNYALEAEGYAAGTQDGTAVLDPTSPYYQNNAKYRAEQAAASAQAAEQSKNAAQAATVHQPIKGNNGNWWIWNQTTGQYEDTGDSVTGDDGTTFTPSVSNAGVISWTNDGNKQNPQSVDLVTAVISALPSAVGVSF